MYTLLLNPISGNGKALSSLPKIEAIMKEFCLPYRCVQTTAPGDAAFIARAAAQRQDEGIVIIGGDGTIFEALSGIAQSSLRLIFAPCGTGNDFVKALNLPLNVEQALRKQLSLPCRKLDYGTVNGVPFMNVCGTGFDVEVLKYATGGRLKGLPAYLMALVKALHAYRPIDCEVSIDGHPPEKRSYAILSIGNGRYFGGGMKVVPEACVNDGLLDFVGIGAVKKWQIPFLLPLFITGKHLKLRITSSCRCREVVIRCPQMTFQMDGELRTMDEAVIHIVPSGLNAHYE